MEARYRIAARNNRYDLTDTQNQLRKYKVSFLKNNINYIHLIFNQGLTGSMMYVPDSQLVQDEDEENLPGRSSQFEGRRSRRTSQTMGNNQRENQTEFDSTFQHRHHQNSHVLITTTKVCTQELPLPEGVEVRFHFQYSTMLFKT